MISEGSCDTEDWRNDAENRWTDFYIGFYLHSINIDQLLLKKILNICSFCVFKIG